MLTLVFNLRLKINEKNLISKKTSVLLIFITKKFKLKLNINQ